MILSGSVILERLNRGEIFHKDTWTRNSVKEASYALRVAPDGLLLDGKYYDPGDCYPGQYLEIKPGTIAILSTLERLYMPNDLVGKIGIRLDYAAKGLTGLMGIQVDPCYGHDLEDERLFIRIANLGNETVKLLPEDDVFTFELHEIQGTVEPPSPSKESTWKRLKRILSDQEEVSRTYVTRVEADLKEDARAIRKNLGSEIANIRRGLEPVVMFGIFLIAVTILGVSLSLILGLLQHIPQYKFTNLITTWAWGLLLVMLSAGTLVTIGTGIAVICHLRRPPRERNQDAES